MSRKRRVYFRPVDNSGVEVKVSRITLNTSSKIIGICPNAGHMRCRVVVKTQFTGSAAYPLKEPRTYIGPFILVEA